MELDPIAQQLPPNPLVCLLQHAVLFFLLSQRLLHFGLLCAEVPVFLVEMGDEELEGGDLARADVLGGGQMFVLVVVTRQLLLQLHPCLQFSSL